MWNFDWNDILEYMASPGYWCELAIGFFMAVKWLIPSINEYREDKKRKERWTRWN